VALKPIFYRFERAMEGRLRVYLSNSEFGIVDGSDHHPDALRMTADVRRIASAARRLEECNLDALVWACTSGSFVNGRAFAEDQVAQLAELTGVPTTSTSLAFVAAAQAMSLEAVALASPYPEPATVLLDTFLSEFDIKVTSRGHWGNPSGWLSAEMGYDEVRAQVARLDLSGCQALLIPDTALPSLSWIGRLEAEIGIPVLTANAVSLWHGTKVGCLEIPPDKPFSQLFCLET
jgi:maleate cis-trans isomerase